jgi:hypothetical protein
MWPHVVGFLEQRKLAEAANSDLTVTPKVKPESRPKGTSKCILQGCPGHGIIRSKGRTGLRTKLQRVHQGMSILHFPPMGWEIGVCEVGVNAMRQGRLCNKVFLFPLFALYRYPYYLRQFGWSTLCCFPPPLSLISGFLGSAFPVVFPRFLVLRTRLAMMRFPFLVCMSPSPPAVCPCFCYIAA